MNGSRPAAPLGGGNRPRNPARTPNPNFTPPPQLANLAVVRGQVTPGGVNGTAVSVRESSGTVLTITAPTTVRVSRSTPVDASALATEQCIAAQGRRSSNGAVAARSIAIVPAGPSGCFSGGGFGGPPGGQPQGGTSGGNA